MTAEQTKSLIKESLSKFGQGNLTKTSLSLFEKLGYTSEKQAPLDSPTFEEFEDNYIGDKNFDIVKAKVSEWKYIDLLFQISREDVTKQASLFDTKKVDQTIIEAYLFFVIELSNTTYTRTELSIITREINRLFPMPAMILFKHGKTLTLSVINRRLHKRDETKDVLEKVTLIKDINIDNPHRAHIEILFDLSFDELRSKHQFTNFVELHNAWQKTLDTKELNKRFYSELFNWYLWAVRSVNFPNDVNDDKDDTVHNSESVIRLLTRLIFVWFIKEKNLVPDSLFEQRKLKTILKNFQPHSMDSSVYYRAILQNLFFATLNTPMDKDITEENKDEKRRFINTLPKTGNDQYLDQTKYRYQEYFTTPEKALELFSSVPFLNGGLFECLDFKEGNKEIRYDGFSSTEKRQAFVPDKLFFADEFIIDLNSEYDTKGKKYKVEGLINIFDSYKFTITENTPLEEEIALDPELLGKVFENLLASYNPETQTTARKQTGSFYTPREIVNYMVDESLIAYFKQKLENSDATENRLRELFSHAVDLPKFSDAEANLLIKAISEAKILDPACGSGAFPMGVLHRLVDLLNKLDPENKKWNELQIQRAIDETAEVFRLENSSEERKIRLNEIERAFDLSMNYPDYARKLFLIENCIYGVDIQQVAIQISKLRFFISLIVDQKVNDDKPNRNILSMPNLETKFVAANTLIGLDKPQQMTLMAGDVEKLEKELASIRNKIFFTRKYYAKKALKKKEKEKREEPKKALISSGFGENTATQMAGWNPFDPINFAKFFDPETMFGFNDGFDVVIGNPPYKIVNPKDELASYFNTNYQSAKGGKTNLYKLFIEKSILLLTENGMLSFINPNTYLTGSENLSLRKVIIKHSQIIEIIEYTENDKVFENVTQAVTTLLLKRSMSKGNFVKIKTEKQGLCNILQDDISKSKDLIFLPKNKIITAIEKASNYTFADFTESYKGEVNLGVKKEFFSKIKKPNSKLMVRGRQIDSFTIIEFPTEYCLFSADNRQHHKLERIIFPEISNQYLERRIKAYLCLAEFICSDTTNYMYSIDKSVYNKYILAILNSRVIDYYFKYFNTTNHVPIGEIRKIPFVKADLIIQNQLVLLSSYLLFYKKNSSDHISVFLERIVNAAVYELYLSDLIIKSGADVLKYLKDLPELSKEDEEKNLKIIEKVYKELSDPKHPISAAFLKLQTIEEINIIEGRK